jgi:hypothetical protein
MTACGTERSLSRSEPIGGFSGTGGRARRARVANRTRAVGGVKSVSRFELQGKTHEATTDAQTGVDAERGDP